MKSRAVAVAAVVVLLLAGGVVAARLTVSAGSQRSVAVTPEQGGVLDLGVQGSVRIPAGGVDHVGTLTVQPSGSLPGRADRFFTPLGAPFLIELEGASLTAPATITLSVDPPATADPDGPFTPVARYVDPAADRWVVADGVYDAGARHLTVTTSHFSEWGLFSWVWPALRDLVTGLVAGTFGTDALAGAAAPSCARESEARARARSQVTGSDNLLWCLDLDTDDQLVLRMVNNRRMAVHVQEFPGTTLDSVVAQPVAIRSLGPVVDQWLAARSGVAAVVLGPGAGATFRVTSLAQQTGIGTAPSAISYLTDVLDIGVTELAVMYTEIGKPGATPADKDQLYQTLFAGGRLLSCLSTLTGLPVLTDPASAVAVGNSLAQTTFSCLEEQVRASLPTLSAGLVLAVGLVGSITTVAFRMLQDLLAGGDYLKDLVSGHTNFFITFAAPAQPVARTSPTTTTPEGATTPATTSSSAGTETSGPAPGGTTAPVYGSPVDTRLIGIRPTTASGAENQYFHCGDTVYYEASVQNPTAHPITAVGVFNTRPEGGEYGPDDAQEQVIEPNSTVVYKTTYRIPDKTAALFGFQISFYVRNGTGSTAIAYFSQC